MDKQEYIKKINAKFGDVPFPDGMSLSDALGEKGDKYLKDVRYDEWVTHSRLKGEEREMIERLF